MADSPEISPVTKKLLAEIDAFCRIFNLQVSRFGRVVMSDPNFVYDLRAGRSVTMLTLGRVTAFMHKFRNAKQLPLDPVRWRRGTTEMH